MIGNYNKDVNFSTLLLGYAPYFDIRLKPPRNICKHHLRKQFPTLSGTHQFITLFEESNEDVISSPVLDQLEPKKINF